MASVQINQLNSASKLFIWCLPSKKKTVVGHHYHQAFGRIFIAVLILSNADPQYTLPYVISSPFTANSHHQDEETTCCSRQQEGTVQTIRYILPSLACHNFKRSRNCGDVFLGHTVTLMTCILCVPASNLGWASYNFSPKIFLTCTKSVAQSKTVHLIISLSLPSQTVHQLLWRWTQYSSESSSVVQQTFYRSQFALHVDKLFVMWDNTDRQTAVELETSLRATEIAGSTTQSLCSPRAGWGGGGALASISIPSHMQLQQVRQCSIINRTSQAPSDGVTLRLL